MNSEIKVYAYPDGGIQRVQVLHLEDWAQVDFLRLKPNKGALDCFYDIYQNYLIQELLCLDIAHYMKPQLCMMG